MTTCLEWLFFCNRLRTAAEAEASSHPIGVAADRKAMLECAIAALKANEAAALSAFNKSRGAIAPQSGSRSLLVMQAMILLHSEPAPPWIRAGLNGRSR